VASDDRRFGDLSPKEQHELGRSLADLQAEFGESFDKETIEHFVVDSYEKLAARATVTTFIGVLSERFARERLSALRRTGETGPGKPSVLFLCVHNAGRSQMAAGWLRHLGQGMVNVYTGGSEPAAQLNPVVVEAMSEEGIDIAEEFPKPWTDEVVRAVDVVIAMGCGDVCPVYPGKRYLDWELDDPAGQSLEAVRVIRDQVRAKVESLVAELAP
jgi:arsenate reductase (thioredoxin)